MRRYAFVWLTVLACVSGARAQTGAAPLIPSTPAIPASAAAAAALVNPLNAGGGLLSFSILGASGATVPLNNGTNVESGLWTFANGLSVNMPSLAPSSTVAPATTGIYDVVTPTGTGCASGYCDYNFFSINGDDIPVGVTAAGFYWNHVFGGAAMTGNRADGVFAMLMNQTTGNTSGGQSYSGLAVDASATANDNGTGVDAPTHVKGILNGENIVMTFGSGATAWEAFQGEEIDMNAAAGSSMWTKAGLMIVQFPTDAVAGTTYDAAIGIDNGAGAVGWKNGIVFGGMEGFWPFQASATAIGCPYGCGALANALDFSGATISGYFLHGPGFAVDGRGNLSVSGNTTLGATSANATTVNGTLSASGLVTFIAGAQVVGNALVYAADTTHPAQLLVLSQSAAQDAAIVLENNLTPKWTIDSLATSANFALLDNANGAAAWLTVSTGGNATLGESATDVLTVKGYAKLQGVTIASLPTCNSGASGELAYVTNGVASPAYNAAVSATGSSNQLVFCNGLSWTYH